MFENFFNVDNRVFRYFDRILDMIVLNVLFLITCIPVITIGPALTSLYYVSVNTWSRGDGYIFQMYWKSFKQNFKQAVVLWLWMAAAGAVAGYNFWFWIQNHELLGDTVGMVAVVLSGILLFLYAVVFTYVWVLLAKFENTTFQTMKNAFYIGIGNLPYTIAIWLIIGLVGILMYYYSAAMACGFLFGFAVIAYLQALIMRKVLKPYLGEERLTPEEEAEQKAEQSKVPAQPDDTEPDSKEEDPEELA